jgi:hypothetical protein
MPSARERLKSGDDVWPCTDFKELAEEAVELLEDHPITPEARIVLGLIDPTKLEGASPMLKWLERRRKFLEGDDADGT